MAKKKEHTEADHYLTTGCCDSGFKYRAYLTGIPGYWTSDGVVVVVRCNSCRAIVSVMEAPSGDVYRLPVYGWGSLRACAEGVERSCTTQEGNDIGSFRCLK